MRWRPSRQQMVDQIFSFGELGFQEVETHRYLVDVLREERIHRAGRHCRNPDGVHGDVGQRQAGHRARIGHRRHSSGVAEAGRRLPRAAHRRRAGARRGPQLRAGRQHHGGDRGEEDHGAREAARHDPHLAGHGRGAGRHQGVLRARRASSRTSTSRCSRTWATTSACRGATATAPGLVSVEYTFRRRDRALGRRAVARPQRARRRRADEHRLELPARAPAARAALALRHHQRRRSAQRRPADGLGLVLLPPDDVSDASRSCGRSATRWPRAPR